MSGENNWLIARDADRRRMLEMDRRLKPIRLYTFAVLVVAFLLCGPWVGWSSIPLLLVAGIFFQVSDRVAKRTSRPEIWIFGAWVGAQMMITAAAVTIDGPPAIATILYVLPIVTLSARFSGRGVIAGVAITLLLLACTTLIADPAGMRRLSAGSDYGGGPDRRSRGPLDGPDEIRPPVSRGVGDRSADWAVEPKGARASRPELSHQSQTADAPIGLVSCDLDHFKSVNDTAGHPTGDIVLQQVAGVIRGQLRAFELAYRIGGEEFLILIPGLGLAEAAELAERLRIAVAEHVYTNGIRVTMSVGVTTSTAGPDLDFASLGGRRRRPLRGEARGPQSGAGRRRGGRTDADPGVGSGAAGVACRELVRDSLRFPC